MLSQNESQIFPPTTGGAEKMCQNMNVSLLGKVPLDPQIGKVTALHLKQVVPPIWMLVMLLLESPDVGTDVC